MADVGGPWLQSWRNLAFCESTIQKLELYLSSNASLLPAPLEQIGGSGCGTSSGDSVDEIPHEEVIPRVTASHSEPL